MRNIKSIAVFLIASVMLVGLILSGHPTLTKAWAVVEETPTPSPDPKFYAETKAIPAELAYWVLFQEIQSLKQRDIESATQGSSSNFKSAFYDSRLGLESSQFTAVDNEVNEFFTALQPIDQRAREVINQYRSQYTNGELKKTQTPKPPDSLQPARPQKSYEPLPPVPAEISQLQNQKNQLILNTKEKIKQALGQTEFTDFDVRVQKNATKVLVPLNLANNVLPALTPTTGN